MRINLCSPLSTQDAGAEATPTPTTTTTTTTTDVVPAAPTVVAPKEDDMVVGTMVSPPTPPVKIVDPLDLEDDLPTTAMPPVVDETQYEGMVSLYGIVKAAVLLAIVGGLLWWLGAMRLVRRYIPLLAGRQARHYRRVGDDDLEK